jgi:hypothetical protein
MTRPCLMLALALLCGGGALAAQDGRRILEVGGVLLSGLEQGAYLGVPFDQEARYSGLRAGLRGGPLFLRGQYLVATLPQTDAMPGRDVRVLEAGAGVFFAPVFRIDGAAFAREYRSALGTQRWVGVKAGAGFHGTVWPGLAEVRAVGHYIPLVRNSVEENRVVLGWDGEVELALRHSKIPLRGGIGYRVERLDSAESTAGQSGSPTIRQQRFSGILLTLQISL